KSETLKTGSTTDGHRWTQMEKRNPNLQALGVSEFAPPSSFGLRHSDLFRLSAFDIWIFLGVHLHFSHLGSSVFICGLIQSFQYRDSRALSVVRLSGFHNPLSAFKYFPDGLHLAIAELDH